MKKAITLLAVLISQMSFGQTEMGYAFDSTTLQFKSSIIFKNRGNRDALTLYNDNSILITDSIGTLAKKDSSGWHIYKPEQAMEMLIKINKSQSDRATKLYELNEKYKAAIIKMYDMIEYETTISL